ncbi:hypothetical protein B0A55_02856 [Friedmanniomyces simplex]|uniref:Uncharacterized protein n=1 Tax=Friedmanniomyces simplex TaxID=329884 RepID=A0A4U0Y186_9PEZI|nr:hypothetical protein B0A55_02856 [Friedmanniomyces simplex]
MAALSKPYIFAIPPELRNRIYELALTCRQIRAGAITIYYDNKFSFEVHAFDGLAVTPFRRLLLMYRIATTKSGKNLSLRLCHCCDGVLFLLAAWLEAFHEDTDKLVVGLRQVKQAGNDSRAAILATRTFGVVRAMRKAPWDEVELVLQVFYDAIEDFQEQDYGVEHSDSSHEE